MADLPIWLAILIKVAFAAALVVTASVLAEKSGPLVAGLIIAMPVSVGSTYIMLGFTATPAFIAHSALGSLASNTWVGVFAAVYILLAQRVPLPFSLGAAALAWFAGAWFSRVNDFSAPVLIAMNLVVYALLWPLTRHAMAGKRGAAGLKRWYDLPLRAALVGLFVGTLVTVSHLIGPAWTGLTAAYPLLITSSIIMMHPRVGAEATAAAMVTVIHGLVIYAAAYWLVYARAESWGVWWSMLVALILIVAWAALLYVLRTRKA